ncbi:hypothetical protein ACHAQA_000493 [Verticillium albo-atrum]
MTTNVGLATSLATGAGITGSLWWAGACSSLSLFTIPPLLESAIDPRQAAHAWSIMFHRGAATGPKVAITSFLALSYAAYARREEGLPWVPYVAGGVLGLLMVPFTFGFMMSTNNALLAGASGAKVLGAGDVKELLARWQTLNLVRGLFPLAGGLVALWDVLRG